MTDNLYVHFPFCRGRCAYCALYSRAGVPPSERAAYVRRLAREIDSRIPPPALPKTVYFGGGTPALCDLSPLKSVFKHRKTGQTCFPMFEFTVELHPLDVTPQKLDELESIGVNRISMGVQSLDDDVLRAMGRGYTAAEAERAFARVKSRFDNAGIDLIVGLPGDPCRGLDRLRSWGLRHCSVYSLQNERGLTGVASDDAVLDRIRRFAEGLQGMGLARYEISNYAVPGFECRHNLAVWRGEDYIGLGEGACGRIGRTRTIGRRTGYGESEVSPEEDLKERTIFRLRTREGIDAAAFSDLPSCPSLVGALDRHVAEGLLTREGTVYRLTARGTEVCDSILVDLV